MTVTIPNWSADGVLPPVSENPAAWDRSPYLVSLLDFVERFGAGSERRTILDGFLRYRSALHACGLIVGLQWLDGSFVEDIEAIAQRPPNDLDVVTFFQLPEGLSERALVQRLPELFDHDLVKQTYHVDSYPIGITSSYRDMLDNATYWYGLWSHTRERKWKGYVALDLAPNHDVSALSRLAGMGDLVNP